ncbi:hypothetical protein F2P79_010037 [Pimephales promelas]|nr:hypothetical protein F2P79_010037 [Pimephales promelas]
MLLWREQIHAANPYPEACRDPFESILLGDLSRPCLTESAKTNGTGCVFVAVDASLFFKVKFEERTQETRLVNVTLEGRDTRGQPVPGRASVEACRDPFESILLGDLRRPCLTESAKTNATGCVSVAVDASLFFNAKFEERTQETRLVNVTWEGTDTRGQPVPGRASVEACRDPFESILLGDLSRPCLTESAKTNGTGCVSVAVDASLFFKVKFEERTQETRLVNIHTANPYPEACRDPFESILLGDLRRPCLTESAKTNATGCVSVAVDASLFFNAKFEERTQETRLVNVTWEGTGELSSMYRLCSLRDIHFKPQS